MCFINHCCPVEWKANHGWGHALLSKFLMHGNYEAGCVPTWWNQTCHIHTGDSARTSRTLIGKLLAAGRGGRSDAHTAAKEHVISSALSTQTWQADSVALSHHLCKSHRHEMNREEMFNASLMVWCLPASHSQREDTDSEIFPLIYMQMMLCSGWQLMSILASKKYVLFKDLFIYLFSWGSG